MAIKVWFTKKIDLEYKANCVVPEKCVDLKSSAVKMLQHFDTVSLSLLGVDQINQGDNHYIIIEPLKIGLNDLRNGTFKFDSKELKRLVKSLKKVKIIVWHCYEGHSRHHEYAILETINAIRKVIGYKIQINIVYGSFRPPRSLLCQTNTNYVPFDFWRVNTKLNSHLLQDPTECIIRNKSFSFYNRRFTTPRAIMLYDLKKNNLLENSVYTFLNAENRGPAEHNQKTTIHRDLVEFLQLKCDEESILLRRNDKKFVKFYNKLASKRNPNVVNNLYDHTLNLESPLDLICETTIRHDELFITEKIYRPITCCNFILPLSSKGTVEHLRTLGFDMFDDLFDHSYDKEDYFTPKWEKILDNLKKWSNKSLKEQQEIYQNNFDRLYKNRKLILETDYNKDVLTVFN